MRSRRFWTLLVAAVVLTVLGACVSPLPTGPRQISITADGAQTAVETQAVTVREALASQGILLGPLDRVAPPETAYIADGTTIVVTRVTEHTETYTSTIPFERQVVRDATVPDGETRLLQAGSPGLLTQVFRVTEEDRVEVERILIDEVVSTAPQNEIRLLGTRPRVQPVDITGVLVYVNAHDAWQMRGNNRERRRITSLGDLDGRVVSLSPDGSRLLFTRAVTGSESLNGLWLVSTVEADSQAVPIAVENAIWADWSRDGTSIAWSTAETVSVAPGWRGRNDLWTGTVARLGTLTGRRQILKPDSGGGFGWWGTRYAWSPTEDEIAWSRPESIGIVSLEDGSSRTLLGFPAYRTYSSWVWTPSVSWSEDGHFLVSVTHSPAPAPSSDPELSPVFDLVALAASGDYSVTLATEVGMWSSPKFAPGGEAVLFGRAVVPYQSDASTYRLCTVDRDGSGLGCVYPPAAEEGIEVPEWEWSPDGMSAAFVSRGDIYIVDVRTGGVVALTDQGATTQIEWRAAQTQP